MADNNEPYFYWNHIAPTKPEAQTLASRLGLDFPASYYGFKSGILYPIRRLIITGEDTPANLALLFGPRWEQERATVRKTRIEVLLCPPPGSPSHTAAQYLDEGSPRWCPRAPGADEQEELAKVREMQKLLGPVLSGGG